MLRPFAGFDPDERQIVPRGPASRFSADEIEVMKQLARSGATSIEIGHQLNIPPPAIRARLWRMGVRLRRRVAKSRVRMVLDVTRRMREAADRRGISAPQLIRRLLRTISANDLFDQILGAPFRSLGAAAVSEPAPHWHNQPPSILRRIELGGCVETPRLAVCFAQPALGRA